MDPTGPRLEHLLKGGGQVSPISVIGPAKELIMYKTQQVALLKDIVFTVHCENKMFPDKIL